MVKICLACSAGGHLTEILQLKDVYKNYEHFFVTFERDDSKDTLKDERKYFLMDPKRNPIKFIINFIQSLFVILKEKPKMIITTGAGVILPICYLGKMLGSKIIFIESFCRIDTPSLTGKLIYPISDIFIVQWEKLKNKYGRKAIFIGRVF